MIIRRTDRADLAVPIGFLRRLGLSAMLIVSAIVLESRPASAQVASESSGPASTSNPVDVIGGADADGVESHPIRRHVLLVVGLPGDEAHRIRFRKTSETWRRWLTTVASVDEGDIIFLSAVDENEETVAPTSDNIMEAVRRLEESIGQRDALWVFLLGHGSHDERHGWFHLPGPDLDSTQWAGLFANIKANEQVIWLTQAASGAFLKPMSRPGRIVITATDTEGEVNETLFPYVLADLMQQQLEPSQDSPAELSIDVLGLFQATSREVSQVYESREILPTEHAQLDDNGDGLGTEIGNLNPETTQQVDSALPLVDGVRAKQIVLSRPPLTESEPESSTDETSLPATPEPERE